MLLAEFLSFLTTREGRQNSVTCLLFYTSIPFWKKGSYLKWKKLLLLWANSFLSEKTLFKREAKHSDRTVSHEKVSNPLNLEGERQRLWPDTQANLVYTVAYESKHEKVWDVLPVKTQSSLSIYMSSLASPTPTPQKKKKKKKKKKTIRMSDLCFKVQMTKIYIPVFLL